MQLTNTMPTHAPGDDLWMVRATLAAGTDVQRYTAVDLEPGDTTPGVFPMQYEHATLRAPSNGTDWTADVDRVEAWDDADAAAVASATYDAARGFLELRLTPDVTPLDPGFQPDRLTLQLGDHRWTFPIASAPAQAWAVLHAAQAVRVDA